MTKIISKTDTDQSSKFAPEPDLISRFRVVDFAPSNLFWDLLSSKIPSITYEDRLNWQKVSQIT